MKYLIFTQALYYIILTTYYLLLTIKMSSKTDNVNALNIQNNRSKETNIGHQEQKTPNTMEGVEKQQQSSVLPNGMTPENAKAINIMKTEGGDAAVKYMFNPTGKRQLSYAEMRMRFG